MRQEDLIQHYGVKGMKWGVRKAAQAGNKVLYAYGSHLAKKYTQKQRGRNVKAKAQLERYHDKRKRSKSYINAYNNHYTQAVGTDKQKHYAAIDAIRKTQRKKTLKTATSSPINRTSVEAGKRLLKKDGR